VSGAEPGFKKSMLGTKTAIRNFTAFSSSIILKQNSSIISSAVTKLGMISPSGVACSPQLEKEAKNTPKSPSLALPQKVEIRTKSFIMLNFNDLLYMNT
jgi:hypothetical protein